MRVVLRSLRSSVILCVGRELLASNTASVSQNPYKSIPCRVKPVLIMALAIFLQTTSLEMNW